MPRYFSHCLCTFLVFVCVCVCLSLSLFHVIRSKCGILRKHAPFLSLDLPKSSRISSHSITPFTSLSLYSAERPPPSIYLFILFSCRYALHLALGLECPGDFVSSISLSHWPFLSPGYTRPHTHTHTHLQSHKPVDVIFIAAQTKSLACIVCGNF